jgi:hypothetical protein
MHFSSFFPFRRLAQEKSLEIPSDPLFTDKETEAATLYILPKVTSLTSLAPEITFPSVLIQWCSQYLSLLHTAFIS